jgi:glycyl-tRNA synthetase beta subunit
MYNIPCMCYLILICTVLQVAEALFEITLTRFSGDILPATDAGIVLSIADR